MHITCIYRVFITFTKENNRLFIQSTAFPNRRWPKVEVYPESESTFFSIYIEHQVEFVKNDRGEVTHCIQRLGNLERFLKKIQ